ncbi:MAG: hypothetical protein HY231_26875 [Acidobacteria bacterium]|nr:hypothetical protein [Acidobacteriota bacterium]
MTAKSCLKVFLVSLVLVPLLFFIVLNQAGGEQATSVTLSFFAVTVLIELVALGRIFQVRKAFSPGDSGYSIWTLILATMCVRLLAEGRLFTLTTHLVPEYQEGASNLLFFFVVVLRYLYTVSDVLFTVALILTIRSYKSTGLPFKLLAIDYFYIAALCTLPVITYSFRANLLLSTLSGHDGYIATFRLVAVTVGAFIASFCVVVRRYALQMGGGQVAKVWSMVVIAGVARDGSFLTVALLSSWSKSVASFTEQYLLWIFACCWLLAALYQSEVFSRTTKSRKAYVAETFR